MEDSNPVMVLAKRAVIDKFYKKKQDITTVGHMIQQPAMWCELTERFSQKAAVGQI
jgi:hypothetical protein